MIKKPRRLNKSFLKTARMGPIKGVVIHNDYGSRNATAEWYLNSFLPNHNLANGTAHYYIDKNTIGRAVDTFRQAWHTGNREGNGHYIGFEVVGSRWDNGLPTDEFKLNEDMALRQAAEDLLFYGIPANRETVRLHREFVPTSCPHRSWDLHGKSINYVKDYFIDKIKYYQSLGSTVDEMIDDENKLGGSKPVAKPKQSTKTKQLLHLPATAKTWNIYRPGGPYTVGNEIHKLTPSVFGGLTYEIKGSPMAHVYLIDTGVKGRVAIYAHPSTGARITTEEIKEEKLPQTVEQQDGSLYIVQAGAYASEENAKKKAEELKKTGHDAIVKKKE